MLLAIFSLLLEESCPLVKESAVISLIKIVMSKIYVQEGIKKSVSKINCYM